MTGLDAVTGLDEAAWPLARLAEAVEALAQQAGLRPRPMAEVGPVGDPVLLGPQVEALARAAGIEARAVQVAATEVDRLLEDAAPAVLRLDGPPRLLLLLGWRRGRALLLGPTLRRHRVPGADLRRALLAPLTAPERPAGLDLVRRLGVQAQREEEVLDALLRQGLGARRFEAGFILRLPAGAPLLAQAREQRLPSLLGSALLLHGMQVALTLASWVIVGRGVLAGRWDPGWLWGWALILLTLVPLRVASASRMGRVGLGLGALLKRRVMLGALRMDPDQVRRQGAGALIGRAIEAEAVETGALQGAMLALLAAVELAFAAGVLALGAGGLLSVAALLLWCGLGLPLVLVYGRRLSAWTAGRIEMTDRLVEVMVGHRTRLAQQDPARLHTEEDAALGAYAARSAELDAAALPLAALLPRGFLVLGLASLAPAFLAPPSATGADATALAVGLGGLLLAVGALGRLAESLPLLVAARVAWATVGPLLRAGRAGEEEVLRPAPRPADPLLEARGLSFRHDPRRAPVLREVSFRLDRGDRVLLEGGSGGGKSTLVSLLAGLRRPDGGLLLCDGVDLPTLGGEGWRRRVAAAPQFHDNHVLSETFAFNALMGRGWPADEQAMVELDLLARELGLGPLLDRMPAGLMQQVGESGWQLSHGERSRLYILRALLQGADVIVLDESFAALDPETLGQALACVLRRAPALVVVAHP